ncbi:MULTISPECIES: hypothetical protein [Streptomyces]
MPDSVACTPMVAVLPTVLPQETGATAACEAPSVPSQLQSKVN